MKFEVPTFETDRLILRAMRISDAPSYQRYFNDFEVISQLSATCPWPYPADGAIRFLSSVVFPNQGQGRWDWGIFLKSASEELVGSIGLWRTGLPQNRGFWLGRPFWGQGFMTEAVSPINDYAFTDLGFEKLIFSNALGNSKSRRIKEKTGAAFLGTRPAKFVNRNYIEAETWELSRESWLALKARVNPSFSPL